MKRTESRLINKQKKIHWKYITECTNDSKRERNIYMHIAQRKSLILPYQMLDMIHLPLNIYIENIDYYI